ncbi:MAG: EamA family transporter [Acidobacteriaceae bacterium]
MPVPFTHKFRIALSFACVYFFWGSTYSAFHIAGLHLAPPLVGFIRSLFSTILICGICLVRRTSLCVPLRAAWQLALVGICFLTVSNLLLIWAESKVATGYASLVIATIPIFVALIETVLPGGETLNLRGWLGTLLGVIGMLALLWPTLHRSGNTGPSQRSLFGFVLLLGAALAFASGSVLSRRFRFRVDTFVATFWQIAAAGLVNLIISIAAGCFRTALWTRGGILAIAYLAAFGSVVGLTAYTYLLKHVPVTKVSTYAFVNPIVAILIGAALFHERLAPTELAGTVLILFAVATVILSRTKSTPVSADPILEFPIEE